MTYSLVNELDEIIDFVLSNDDGMYRYVPRDEIGKVIQKHIEYGTFLMVRDEKGIVTVVRWNWDREDIAHIIDLIVRPDYRTRGNNYIKRIILLGVSRNPRCKFISFDRPKKYPNRKRRTYSIYEIFNTR